MRVLLVTAYYPPVLGGAELQAQSLARALHSLGVEVSILTRALTGMDSEAHEEGIHVFRRLRAVPLGPLWGVTYVLSARHWLRRLAHCWHLVQAQQVGLHAWSAVQVAKSLGRPSLLRCSSFGPGGDLAVLRSHRFGGYLLRTVRDATRVVSLTQGGSQEVACYGIPSERVRVIPNGVDLARFLAQPWPTMRHGDPLRLLFVGRLATEKGLGDLLSALALVTNRGAFSLRVVGTGALEEALRTRTRVLQLMDVVEFVGARPDVVADYAWSELLVVPSHFEGMPNVVLEAMACARPVLGTRVNGTTDLVAEGRTGWLVPRSDPAALARELERLSAQRQQLRLAGEAGRALMESTYGLNKIAARYLQEYEAMLREGGGSPDSSGQRFWV